MSGGHDPAFRAAADAMVAEVAKRGIPLPPNTATVLDIIERVDVRKRNGIPVVIVDVTDFARLLALLADAEGRAS